MNLAHPLSSVSVAAGWETGASQGENAAPAAGAVEFTSPKSATQSEPGEKTTKKKRVEDTNSDTMVYCTNVATFTYILLGGATVWSWLENGSKSSLLSSSSESESAGLSGPSVLEAAVLSHVWLAAWLWEEGEAPNLIKNKTIYFNMSMQANTEFLYLEHSIWRFSYFVSLQQQT